MPSRNTANWARHRGRLFLGQVSDFHSDEGAIRLAVNLSTSEHFGTLRRMTLKIAGARAAIKERLNSPIEISKLEHEAIEAARIKLSTLKTGGTSRSIEAVRTRPLRLCATVN
jgi:hypothetical protein